MPVPLDYNQIRTDARKLKQALNALNPKEKQYTSLDKWPSLSEISLAISNLRDLGIILKKRKKAFTIPELKAYFDLSVEDEDKEDANFNAIQEALQTLNTCTSDARAKESRLTTPSWLKACGVGFQSVALTSILIDIFTVATNIPASPFYLSASLLSWYAVGIAAGIILLIALALAVYLYQKAKREEDILLFKWKCISHELQLAKFYNDTFKAQLPKQPAKTPRINSRTNLAQENSSHVNRWWKLKSLAKLGEGFSTYMSTIIWNIFSIGALLGVSLCNTILSTPAIIIPMFIVVGLISVGIFAHSVYIANQKKDVKRLFNQTKRDISAMTSEVDTLKDGQKITRSLEEKDITAKKSPYYTRPLERRGISPSSSGVDIFEKENPPSAFGNKPLWMATTRNKGPINFNSNNAIDQATRLDEA